MPEPSPGSRPRLPVLHMREARPYLEAPFTADTIAALAANVLDRAERQPEPRPLLRSALEALIAVSPGGLQARTAARRTATTNPAGDVDDDQAELIEVDFSALGPKPRRWAA